jgi:phospholipid transport system substrate-binding protein
MLHWLRSAAIGLAVAAMLTLSVSPARAANEAVDFIQTRQFLVAALLRLQASEQRDRQVSTVLDRMCAYEEMAKQTLPDHWKDLSEGQQAEFTAILKRIFQRNYEGRIERILGYKMEFTSEDLDSDEVMVHVRATSGRPRRDRDREEVPVAIDYRLVPKDSGFKIIDVTAGGGSFVKEYQNKLQPIYEKDGFEAVIKYMKGSLAATI